MLADIDKLKELLEDFGIPYSLSDSYNIRIGYGEHYQSVFGTNGSAEHSTIDGYSCFYSQWEFDEYGQFVKTGSWE